MITYFQSFFIPKCNIGSISDFCISASSFQEETCMPIKQSYCNYMSKTSYKMGITLQEIYQNARSVLKGRCQIYYCYLKVFDKGCIQDFVPSKKF